MSGPRKKNSSARLAVSQPAEALATPVSVIALADPGADTARRFRYQYGYALVLLVRGAMLEHRFRAIWCEQHEDILGEMSADQFDAFQVKTQKPEDGYIECGTPSFAKSVARFANHEEKFGTKINRYVFISNAAGFTTQSVAEAARSPERLIAALRDKTRARPDFAKAALARLVKDTGIEEARLLPALMKLEIIKGPDLDGLNAHLHVVLHKLEGCAGWYPYQLEQLRDYLLGKIQQASSLGGEDPARYYCGLNEPRHPELQNKRLTPAEVQATLLDFGAGNFRYLAGLGQLKLSGSPVGARHILRQKMQRGGLDYYYDSLLRKTVTAEQEFLALIHHGKEGHANQIECVVKDTCDQARLAAETTTSGFGKPMLLKMTERLSEIARNDPANVHQKTPEFLLGVAGMLAENCQVWWTEPFELTTP